MDRPWSVICGDLDRKLGRRFPPVGGRGRGYRLDVPLAQMTRAEIEVMQHEALGNDRRRQD